MYGAVLPFAKKILRQQNKNTVFVRRKRYNDIVKGTFRSFATDMDYRTTEKVRRRRRQIGKILQRKSVR